MQKFLKSLATLAIALATACGNIQTSQTTSVDIPQTGAKDQAHVGFCWAYAVVGMVESQYKTVSQKEIDLSEEALGFYRMAHGIHAALQGRSAADIIAILMPGGNEGIEKLAGDPNGLDAMSLLERYGAVPESVWSFKFSSESHAGKMREAMGRALLDRVYLKLRQGKAPKDISMDEVIQRVMVARGAYPSVPPTSFDWEGQNYSARDFVHNVMQFNPHDFVEMSVRTGASAESILTAAKKALSKGIAVPLGFAVSHKNLKDNRFTARGVDLNAAGSFPVNGGHAVLLTDFVNLGGKEGALPEGELAAERDKGLDQLDYMVMKNSWGFVHSPNGFYQIDREYFFASAKNQLLAVVVPRGI